MEGFPFKLFLQHTQALGWYSFRQQHTSESCFHRLSINHMPQTDFIEPEDYIWLNFLHEVFSLASHKDGRVVA
jgi:hypothetical protein